MFGYININGLLRPVAINPPTGSTPVALPEPAVPVNRDEKRGDRVISRKKRDLKRWLRFSIYGRRRKRDHRWNRKAYQLMSYPVHMVDSNESLSELKVFLDEHSFHWIPLFSEEKILGVISREEAERVISANPLDLLIKDKDFQSLLGPVFISHEYGLEKIVNTGFDMNSPLFVLNQENECVGIITQRELKKGITQYIPFEVWG